MMDPRPSDALARDRVRWSTRIWILVILSIALATTAFALRVNQRIQPGGAGLLSTDGQYHDGHTDRLLAGGTFETRQCPGYTWYFYGLKRVFGDGFQIPAVVIQMVLLAFAAIIAGRLLSRISGPRAGAVVTIALVVSPHLVNHASQLRPEILCMACVTLALPPLVASDRSPRGLILAAVWMALACMIRNSVLPVSAALGLWLLLLDRSDGRNRLRTRFRHAFLYSIAFLALIAPWCAFASMRAGKLVLIADNSGRAALNGLTRDEYVPVSELRGKRPEPGVLPYLEKRVRLFCPMWLPLPFSANTSRGSWLLLQAPLWILTPGFLLALLFGGLWRSRLVGACAFPALLYTVSLSFVYVHVRYRYPIDPMIYIAAVWGLCRILEAWRARRSRS